MRKTLTSLTILCFTTTYAGSNEVPFFLKFLEVKQPVQVEAPSVIEIAMDYKNFNIKNNRKELKELMSIDPALIPWCAGFTNSVLDKAGYKTTGDLLASSYHKYGVRVKEPEQGDIVITRRKGGSGRHVAFYYGSFSEDGVKYVQLLGGNQNKGVTIAPVPAKKIVEYRRPIKKTA